MSSATGAGDDAAPPHISSEEVVEGRPVHSDAKALFNAVPCLRYVPIFGTSVEAYGPKCVLSVGLSEFLCKGVADYLIRISLLPMFRKHYGVDGMAYQRFANLSMLGWSLKPLTAMFSDIFSFFGYTKRWYLAVSCVVGAVFALAFGLLPGKKSSAPLAAAFVFLTCFTKANVDILTQGHYSRLLRRIPLAGSSLVSWVWWWVLLGSLVASVIVGPLADARLETIGVFLGAALQLVTTLFFVMNWYGEQPNRVNRAEDAQFLRKKLLGEATDANTKPQAPGGTADNDNRSEHCSMVGLEGAGTYMDLPTEVVEEDEVPPLPLCCFGVVEVNKEVAKRNWRIVLYCLLMTCGSVAMAIVTILGDTWDLLYACASISVFLCGFGFFALPVAIAKANLYSFLSMAAYIQLPGALDSFFTAAPDCLPDGPHFSYFFYNTVATIIGNIGGIAGVTLFRYIFSNQSYRITFIVTTAVMVVASIFDLIIVERWNRPKVSDHAVFVLGDAIVYQVCYLLNFMPNIILISRLCPRGTESMVYALLAGFSSFGQSVSNTIGSLLMEFKWPVETDPDIGCDFSNVKWLVIVGHLLCPLISIPLVFILIPAARICDNIDVDGKVIRPEKKPSDDGDETDGMPSSDREPVSK